MQDSDTSKMSAGELDAVSLGIMWDRLVALTDEIVSTLVRSSFSTIVSESYDLSCVVLDADAWLPTLEALREAKQDVIGVVATKDERSPVQQPSEQAPRVAASALYGIGTLCRIHRVRHCR